jgi:glycosyltransferase involved in cell wall biosynthesis
MKVALVSVAPPYSGIGKYAFNLFQRFYDQGRDIDMLYCDAEGNMEFDHSRIKVLRPRFRWPFKGKTLLPQYYYFPRVIPREYDVYHVTVEGLSRVAKFRKPCIITHMDLAPLFMPQMYPFALRMWEKLTLRYYKDADRIIAISEGSRGELLELGIVPPEKIRVVHHGYDERLYHPVPKTEARERLGLPQDKKIILNVGSEDPRKDVPSLLKAVYKVQREIPDAMLVRVGAADSANEALKRQISVKQYQGIPEAQMPLFYNSADLFAFPSIYEGFGLPVIEAMACGIPTIVTSALKLFHSCCAVVPVQNADALAASICEILTDSQRQIGLSLSALEEAKKYTLSQEVDETYKVYQEIFNETKGVKENQKSGEGK